MNKSISFLLIGFMFLTACTAQTTSTAFIEIDSETFLKFRQDKKELLLVDVRTPEEFKSGRISGSSNVDVKQSDFESQIQKLDKNKPVVVYCLAGTRSDRAMQIMKKNGFKEVYNLKGGIETWKKEGRPVVKQ
ncbi:MAG: rhodanese-like domain-containing protein [Flammeovirgaceae bacterium]|nr:rhodanese-like domain-containing protein [Flammeovirgaceae bacterium]